MVIDGLDEINDIRIWDYLPSKDHLPDNIYLLLTFRDVEKDSLSPSTSGKIQNIRVNQKLLVDAKGDPYKHFMMSYIDSMIQGIPAEAKQTLVELSDYKMLNLSPVCKLVKYGYPIKELTSSADILSAYWNEIKKQYGPSEFARLKDIASFFCMYSDESVSINDLAYLYYNGQITYGLLGIISDMMPFLSVERGYNQNGIVYQGENRYRFSNHDIAKVLKSLIPDYKETVCASLFTIKEEIRLFSEKAPDTIPFSEDDLVVFAHSMSFKKNIKDLVLSIGENVTRLLGKDNQGVLIEEDIDQAISEYDASEALALVLTQPVDILYKQNAKPWKPGAVEHSVIGFLRKLESTAKMQVKQHIYKASDQVCNIYDDLSLSDSDYWDYYHLTKIMTGLLSLEGSYETAIHKYIALLDRISKSGNQMSLIQKHVLIDVANIYIKMEKYDDAQKFFNVALGMDEDTPNDILLAANVGLLKAQIKTGDIDSSISIVEIIKECLANKKYIKLLYSDYDYFTLFCEACFEYVRFLNIIEKKVDKDTYQACEKTIDFIMTIVLNQIENAHRESRLRNYNLLIELYKLEGELSLKPHKIDKLDYSDWAVIYFQQVLKLYDKARQNEERIDEKAYLNLSERIKKLLKKLPKSSPTYYWENRENHFIPKKVDVNSNIKG